MNFDHVKFLRDYVARDICYERYKNPLDNEYFDELDYFSIKMCLAIEEILDENENLKRELEKMKNDKNNE